MDVAKIRRRIEDVWELLPQVFTTRDVLRAARMSKDVGSVVRVVLDGMVGEGRLFRSLIPNGLGRRPAAWAKDRSGVGEEVLLEVVRAVLPQMPDVFTMRELLKVLGMSFQRRIVVRGTLDRLADEGVVIALLDLQLIVGRPTQRWTANPRRIAVELASRAQLAAAKKEWSDWDESQLDRLLKPWSPFSSSDS